VKPGISVAGIAAGARRPFPVRDGRILPGIPNERGWLRFSRDVPGQPDLAADQRFRSDLDRAAPAGELAGIIGGVLADCGRDAVSAPLPPVQAAGQQPGPGPVPAAGEHNAAIRAELAGETTKGT
jgi:crotonobetainyl-CoA:carnitine CoA-transferase CaiB-like acyl-CoA transferase